MRVAGPNVLQGLRSYAVSKGTHIPLVSVVGGKNDPSKIYSLLNSGTYDYYLIRQKSEHYLILQKM